jgi:eukaryotic-like serine/threonine-protein kinase
MDAAARAFRHRERLSENERLATEAYYYTSGPEPNIDRALAAYETMLQRDPGNMIALNNAGVTFAQNHEWAKAEERYRAAIAIKRPFGTSFYNLIVAQLRRGKLAAAESTLARFRERFPAHENIWESEFVIRWSRNDIQGADSLARRIWATSTNPRQRRAAAALLASLSLRGGRIREGMRWRSEEHDVIYRATRAPEQPLLAVTDSADAIAFFLQDLPRARAMVRRALTRWPLRDLPAASRPWNSLAELAVALRDGQLAREFQDGFERDIPALGLARVDAERARMRAWVAMASSRYDDAVNALREAESAGPIFLFDRRAMVGLADAFDLGGKSDSALAYYEKFLRTPAAFPHDDAFYQAGTYKRLGELYEARGDFRNAEANYARFVELWQGADPELQPKVRDVRDRLTRLRRQQG